MNPLEVALIVTFFVLAAVCWFGQWIRNEWRAINARWDADLPMLRDEFDRDAPYDHERDGAW